MPPNDIKEPVIRRLTIERFRGIEKLDWYPAPGVNVILGGGDVGKTTILEAIALLLSPTNQTVLSDADYWRREVENGFSIKAVMSLPDRCGINQHKKITWPWQWDGKEVRLPGIDEQPDAEIVYCLCVRGTDESDLVFEVVQPDKTVEHFSVAVRRKIGLIRLGGDDRNDRDLRLIQGSALDRLLADKTLRPRLAQKLGASDIEEELKGDAKGNLERLERAFQEQALPSGLGLGLTGGPGLSVNALIGLTANKDNVKLPLASWGAGTRRLAALGIAAAHHEQNPITIVDEIERGFEPYRQRLLMTSLQGGGSQVFLTTHSAAALSAAASSTLWYVDSTGAIGKLPVSVVWNEQCDFETFLARVAIIAEGLTEIGFVRFLLKKAIGADLLDYGLWVTNGGGNDHTLQLLEGLVDSGLKFGGFADDEERNSGRWATVQERLGCLLFRWPSGCIEENIIKRIPAGSLEEFIQDPNGDSGERLRTLQIRLNCEGKEFSTIASAATDLPKLIIEAATGCFPERIETYKGEKKAWGKHAERWFKSEAGGDELAAKMFAFGVWPQLQNQLLPFINAVRGAVSLPEINELPS